MIKNKTAIIIGAGIGGIATAVYLAKNGYEVCVYEKNLSPGGRCGQLIRDGHRFDLGATMLLMPGVYRQVFGELGISLEEGKDIVSLEDLYTIWFDNGEKIDFTSDEPRMKEQLEKIEPGSFEKSKKYVTAGYNIFRLEMDKLVGRNFYNIFQFANFKNIGLLIRLKTYISNWNYARKFFHHPHLMMAYTFQNIYVGQSPFNSPALFSMVPAAELTGGHDTLSIVVGAAHIDKTKDQDWNLLKQKTRSAVIERLKKLGLSDIEEHIKFEICYTPESWETVCNITRGSIFGSLGHNMMQMGYFRPHNRHDKYHNLYFVGGSTHPGNGIPNILMSSKLVAERIMSGK